MKRITLFIIFISVAVTLSACDSGEKARLIRELYEELESKTEYCESLKTQNDELSHKVRQVEYERDAFIEENEEQRAQIEKYSETEEILKDAVGSANYSAGLYRQDLADIAEFMTYDEVFCPYSDEIPQEHREAIDYYMAEYVDMLKNETTLLHDPEVILGIISVSSMPRDELNRPARQNCTYYKVIYYASRINPYEPGEIYIMPRGIFDGLITYWLIEVEAFEEIAHVIVFEPNA